MSKSSSNRITFHHVLYGILKAVIFPVGLLWDTVIIRNEKLVRYYLTLFVVIYGMSWPMNEKADGYRHLQMVYDEYLNMDFGRFIDDLFQILTFQLSSSSADLYKHLISFISGSILGMPFLFFFIVSLVYGYFFSGVMIEVFQSFKKRKSYGVILWFFILYFILNKNIEGIQTVRTWTGMWVLFYAVIMYTKTKKYKYLFLLMLPPFIHFGYFIMAIPTFLVLKGFDNVKVWAILFFISFFFSTINLDSALNRFSGMALVTQKINQYGENERLGGDDLLAKYEHKVKLDRERTWYKKLDVGGQLKWPFYFFVGILLVFKIPKKFMEGLTLRLFTVGLATLAGSNFLFFISAASNRMNIIGVSFLSASFIILLIRNEQFSIFVYKNKIFKRLLYVIILLMMPKFIFQFSFLLSQTSIFIFAAPLVPILYADYNMAIIDVIKVIFGLSDLIS